MPKPQATPQPARARTSESPGRTGSRQSITVNVVWVWLALAGVLAALLGVWSIAYWRGGSEARERLARYEPAETNVPPVAAPKPNVPNKPVPTLDKPVGTSKLPAPAETSPKQGTQTPAAPASDTRQVGFNYLLCASGLEKSAAEGAAGYLTQNGVPAIAVPTSKGGSKYTVYTLLGIPSGSLDDQLKVRNDHKAEVTRLGKQWRKDHPGASDFSDAYWEKYKP